VALSDRDWVREDDSRRWWREADRVSAGRSVRGGRSRGGSGGGFWLSLLLLGFALGAYGYDLWGLREWLSVHLGL
jgi:hypothetical protein